MDVAFQVNFAVFHEQPLCLHLSCLCCLRRVHKHSAFHVKIVEHVCHDTFCFFFWHHCLQINLERLEVNLVVHQQDFQVLQSYIPLQTNVRARVCFSSFLPPPHSHFQHSYRRAVTDLLRSPPQNFFMLLKVLV